MLHRGMTKSEIEEEIEDKGDFVKINYLTNFLEENISLDMKKFIFTKLVKIYESKKMFADAAKIYDNLAKISIAFSEKIRNHVKEAEMFIKAGNFTGVDESLKKARGEANASEKQEIVWEIKNFYLRQAEVYEKTMRRAHALKIYEKVLEMQLNDEEKKAIKEKIDYLYEKLGKVRKVL